MLRVHDIAGASDSAPAAAHQVVVDQAKTLADGLLARSAVAAVILLGSVARAEEAVAWSQDHWELFGDIEMLAVTNRRLDVGTRRALAAGAAERARQFGHGNALFHVDVLFRERSRLRSMPPSIFTHELRADGLVLGGLDVRSEVRRVTVANLDRKNTHEILMKRLMAMADCIPESLVRGEALDYRAAQALGVGLNRQPLDVPTVLLPEAGVLLPTYGERLARWAKSPTLQVRAAVDRSFGASSAGFLLECHRARLAALPPADAAALAGQAARLIAAALAWLLAVSVGDVASAVARRSRVVFNERPMVPGEWRALVTQALDLARTRGPAWSARWVVAPRKGILAAGLLHLLCSLDAHLTGQPEVAEAELANVRHVMDGVDAWQHREPAGDRAYGERWLGSRRELSLLFWRTVRLGDPAAAPRSPCYVRAATETAG